MFRVGQLCVVTLAIVVCVSTATAQEANSIAKIYIADADGHVLTNDVGTVHIMSASGDDMVPPKEKGQVGCSDAKISPDKRTAGWLVSYENCCTSYPIPLTVVLFRSGKVVQRIAPGQMVYDWHFWKNDSVAVSDGPTHNPSGPKVRLYDIPSGKLLKEWSGEYGDKLPLWAEGLRN
jgi:hypothetical protein